MNFAARRYSDFASELDARGRRPTSGLTPAFQSGGPHTIELSRRWAF